jgi:16S rRNA (guanine(966)-N(2))-methyltransferase RsmD
MSLRIIAGEKRGAVLQAPAGLETRPTLGRVRESLFMILQYDLPEARVLDLYAGCGALGLEALSRGSSFASFVEQAPAARAALEANLRKLGWLDRGRIITREVIACLRQSPGLEPPYDLILLDPPYRTGLAAKTLDVLSQNLDAWLAPEGMVVAQAGRREALPERYGALRQFRQETYGATLVAFYRRDD